MRSPPIKKQFYLPPKVLKAFLLWRKEVGQQKIITGIWPGFTCSGNNIDRMNNHDLAVSYIVEYGYSQGA